MCDVYDVYDVYVVYDDSRRYTNATNTSTSDIMKEMVLFKTLTSITDQCVCGIPGWVGKIGNYLGLITRITN